MEFDDVIRARRMVRSFDGRPVAPGVLDHLLDQARRGPSAGFTQGTEFLVLEGGEQTGRFWDATLPPGERAGFPWPGLLRAPVLVVPMAHMDAYLERYAEPDKGWSDRDPARWPVPFWEVDAAFATMLLLLGAVNAGLGAVFFGIFRGADALRRAFGVPGGFEPIGAVALGHPAGDDRPSSSVARGRRPLEDVVHRGRW